MQKGTATRPVALDDARSNDGEALGRNATSEDIDFSLKKERTLTPCGKAGLFENLNSGALAPHWIVAIERHRGLRAAGAAEESLYRGLLPETGFYD